MKSKMKSGSLKIAIFALSLLLCFALAIGVSSAFYQAKRQASGTVIMDQGIIIDYKGFAENATATTWGKGVNLLLFETTDAQPGQNIEVKNTGAVSSIKANVESVDFYARLKLNYEFYNGETKLETLPASFKASDLITTSTSFFGDSWVESSADGYFYYGSGSILHKFDQATDFVALFADGAKFIIEGENFVGADNEGQGGGFKIDETTSINKIVVTLTLETLQGSADASAEGWTLAPISRIDINEIVDVDGIYEITIDDLIPDDDAVRNNEVILAGDPTQQITITIGSKAFAGCPNLNLSLSDSENIVYQIASDAFANSNGATIMYGLNNVSTELISPSTSGKEVGIENRWKVSDPNLYLFLPSAIESVSSNYTFADSQGEWKFYLIDENGNRVETTSTASMSANTLASTYSSSNLTAVIMRFDLFSSLRSELTTLSVPTNVRIDDFGEAFSVTGIEGTAAGSVYASFMGGMNYGIEEIHLPNTLSQIGDGAFVEMYRLKSITIPDSVTSIGNAAFCGCKGLTSITIPANVTSIGTGTIDSGNYLGLGVLPAFDSTNLKSIIVDANNPVYHSSANCLIETASKTLIKGWDTSVIPTNGSVTKIGHHAFQGTSINIIPEGIVSIEPYAFVYSRATSITIPNSVTSIGEGVFRNSSLSSVVIGSGLTRLSKNMFDGCNHLTSLTIPDNITSLSAADITSSNYSSINLINIGAGVRYLSLPKSVTSVTISENNPYFATDGKAIFAKQNGNVLELNKYFSTETTYSIPSKLTLNGVDWTVTSIGSSAFYYYNFYSNLISITIPDSVTSIGSSAFYDCRGLTDVTIPNGVTSIGPQAFQYCTNLTSITIGNGVTNIGYYAFQNCSSLTSITIPDSVTSIGENPFYGCQNLTTINIGAGVTEVSWLPSSATSVTISANNENLASDGSSIFTKKEGNVLELSKFIAKNDTSYSIPSKLTLNNVDWNVISIGKKVFDSCTNLISITIPNNITIIETGAFARSGITSITIPDSVTSIGSSAFYQCYSLESATIGDGVTSIGSSAFWECGSLTSVTIGNSVTSIGTLAFCGCTSLTSVTIPNSVTSIGTRAFSDCSSLTSITIGNSVTSLENNAFYNCTSLESITIPDSVTSIGNNAFYNCTSLQTAVLPEGITSVPNYCFYGCTNLTTVTIPSTVTNIGDSAFENCTNVKTVIWNVTYNLGEFNATATQKVQLTGNTTNGLTISGTLQAAPTDIEDGLTFEGWTDGTEIYPAGSNYTFALTNRALKAVWSKCVITFDANGGEGSADKIIVEKGSSTTLPAVTDFTKTGYRAIGWSTNKDAASAEYAGEASYTPTTDVTFYIVWEAAKTITFDLNGGTGTTPDVQFVPIGNSISLPTVIDAVKEGYKAIGWSTSSTATYASYNFGTTYTIGSSDVTFYLVWEKAVTVTFDLNGGTGTTPEVMYTFNSNRNITLPTPVVDNRDGYKVLGWATYDYATSAQYSFGYNYYASSDVTFYLVWEKAVTVAFDLNGGTGVDTPETIYIFRNDSSQFTMPTISGATREGYSLGSGWSRNKDARTPDSGCSFGNTEFASVDVTFYLVWIPKVTMEFDLDGGTGVQPDPISVSYGESFITNTGNAYTKGEYLFGGWNLVNLDTNTVERIYYCNENSNYFSGTGTNYVLRANWVAKTEIKFYSDAEKTQYVSIWGYNVESWYGGYDWRDNRFMKTIPYPTSAMVKEGYVPYGWATSADSTSVNWDNQFGNSTNNVLQDEYYLVWKPVSEVVTIRFHLLGYADDIVIGKPSGNSINGNQFPNLSVKNDLGQKILGWSKTEGATEWEYNWNNGMSIEGENGSTIDLYPVWGDVYTITFDPNGGIGDVPADIEVTAGGQFEAPSITLTKEDCVFLGWSFYSDNSANLSVKPGQSTYYSFAANTTLYAVWASPVTIKFDLNGGAGEGFGDIPNVMYGDRFTIPTTNPTREGYTFSGWTVIGSWDRNSSSSSVWGGENTSYFISGQAIILARWSKEEQSSSTENTNSVFVGSLTESQLAEYQGIWGDVATWDSLTSEQQNNLYTLQDKKLHSLLGNVNVTNANLAYTTSGGYGVYWSTGMYYVPTGTFTFEFVSKVNMLPTSWKLVNMRHQVISSGEVNVVDGKAQATIDYIYVQSFADSTDSYMLLFIMPDSASNSTQMTISAQPNNAIGNGWTNNGIKIELFNSSNNLIWSNNGSFNYNFTTGTYKLRVYTTNIIGFVLANSNNEQLTDENIQISEVTKGDGYSEVTITYTFAETNVVNLIFTMNDVDSDSAQTNYSWTQAPYNLIAEMNQSYIKLMKEGPQALTKAELNYLGYLIMLQNYGIMDSNEIISFSIYTENGKVIDYKAFNNDNHESVYLEAGRTYTIKFDQEVKGWATMEGDMIPEWKEYLTTYNAETNTWDVTITNSSSSWSDSYILLKDMDFVANGYPAYDENVDYTGNI